ncbi:MAG: Smr/MutS family protein [Pseudomonadota bacterium]
MSANRRKPGKISPEDMALWRKIVDSVKPLHQSTVPSDLDDALENDAKPVPPRPVTANPVKRYSQPTAMPYQPPSSASTTGQFNSGTKRLDDKTIRKLRKGRLEIDATLDLHGMAQIQAHRSLIDFIEREQRNNSRMILVITGKGKAGQGILRDAVPRWLLEQPLRDLVSGWRNSNLNHGGEGALYVRLKRPAVTRGNRR